MKIKDSRGKGCKKADKTGRKQSAVNKNPKKKRALMTKGFRDVRYHLVSVYEDDVIDDVNDDGDVTCDWIQCTNEQCSP